MIKFSMRNFVYIKLFCEFKFARIGLQKIICQLMFAKFSPDAIKRYHVIASIKRLVSRVLFLFVDLDLNWLIKIIFLLELKLNNFTHESILLRGKFLQHHYSYHWIPKPIQLH